MKGWHFKYTPLSTDKKGTLDNIACGLYLVQSFLPSQLEDLVINPLDQAIIKSGQKELDFQGFKVRVEDRKGHTSWSAVYEKLKTFLEVRSNHVRKYKEGFGYCIQAQEVINEIENRIKEFTSKPESPVPIWPRIQNIQPPLRELLLPQIDYSKISKEAASNSMRARKFRRSLTEEVIKSYRKANEIWVGIETGYGRKNIPPKEESPIKRVRHVEDFGYIIINLVREDKHDYKTIIQTIFSDLTAIQQKQRKELWKIYMPTGDSFVNIKRVNERLNYLYNLPENIKPDVRYEIVP